MKFMFASSDEAGTKTSPTLPLRLECLDVRKTQMATHMGRGCNSPPMEVVHNQPKEEVFEKMIATYLCKKLTRSRPLKLDPCRCEVRGSDSAQYVHVPLDIVLAYHFGVFCSTQKLPTSVALDLVTRRDEHERGIWVKQFQTISRTLGAIIQRVMEK